LHRSLSKTALICCLLSFFCPDRLYAQANHIQQASNSDISSKTYTSFTAVFPSSTTTGNAIVVGVTFGNANATITATDSQANTYVQAVKTYDSRHNQGCAILYAANIKGGASNTVSVKFSTSVAYLALGIHEYSGLVGSSPLDVTSGSTGTGTTPSSGNATTTTSGDLIFGCSAEDAVGQGDTFTAGTGFTKRVDLGNAAAYADEDKIQTLAGSTATTWTLSPSRDWVASMAAFKTAGSGNTVASITSLSPVSGAVGTMVTMAGANFGATQGTSTVSFNGTIASPSSWSATSIVAPVPSGATTGNVVVTVGGLASNGLTFTVVPPPSITSLSPASGSVGTSVTMAGANFGATQGTSTISFNGTIASPSSWSATSIVAPVPNGATTGNVTVTVAGQTSNAVNFTVVPPPSITGLSPASAAIGTSVTITGANFGATQGSSTVSFNGTSALPSSWSATSIVAPVPNGATTGKVTVTVAGQTSNGASFAVIPPPSITSLSPNSGAVGTLVTITGTSFGASQGTSRVAFNGALASPSSWSDTSIVTPVPLGATTGNVIITINTQVSNGVPFSLPPILSNVSPASGTVGTSVTISGSNFGATQGTSTVSFNGIVSSPSAWSATSIVVPVPSGATTGNITVTVNGQTSTGIPFGVIPAITSLSPNSGVIGTSVTITGTSFGASQGASIVSFNGTVAAPSTWTDTSIVTLVPNGATAGNITVTVNGQTSSGVSFAVLPPPSIASLSPTSGGVGTPVTITGTNFGGSQGTSTVTFNGVVAAPISWSDTSIVAPAPKNVTTGNVTVSVGGQPSNGVSFTVVPAPSIANLSPTFGAVGTSVVISGLNFGASQGTSTVSFNGTPATPTTWTDTSIVTTAPNGATTGNVTVTVSSQISSGVPFIVAPNISNLSPNSGPVGGSVVITGANFGASQGTSTISFNGMAALPVSWSDTSIVALVPGGAASGSVLVTVNSPGSVAFNSALLFNLSAQSGVPQAISNVSQCGNATGQPIACPTSTVGNLLIVSYVGASGDNLISVTDNKGNTYVDSGQHGTSSQGGESFIFYAANASAGVTSWTFTTSVNANLDRVVIYDVGNASATPFDNATVTSNNFQAAAGPFSGPPITVTTPNGIVVTNVGVASNGIVGVSAPFTLNMGNLNKGWAHLLNTPAGTFIPTWTADQTQQPGVNSWGGTAAAFEAATISQASNGVSFAVVPPPSISSLSPNPAVVGTSVTIAGANFGATQGTSTVSFNGTVASPSSWSATSIIAPVPPGATTGNVVVTVGGQPSNGITLTVVQVPSIANLSPTSSAVGTPVTIAGTNFGATQGTSTVSFNGTIATPSSWSATSIVVPVPSGATTGNVVVTVGGQPSNAVIFTVVPPPSITSLSPSSAGVGASVTVAGANFGATQSTSMVSFNGTIASPSSWSATSIVAPVPNGATTGNVTVTVAGQTSNSVSFTVVTPPSITSLSPASAGVGTSVTITGANFGPTQGTSTVAFNGTIASPSSWTATSIVVPVPSGATTGNIVVTVGGQASNGVAFTLLAQPSITSLSPNSGSGGTLVTITGSNFGATQGASAVSFNGTIASPSSWSATSIAAPVPTGATTGNVTVTVGGQISNGVVFTVPAPRITSLTPTSGAAGVSVTIKGTSFGASQGTSTVAFNGIVSTPTAWTNTSISAPVPSGATTGNIVVTVAAQASNGLIFTVPAPSISSLSPTSGSPGTSVTIKGTNFGSTQSASIVTFNGIQATPGSWSTTSVVAPVPNGARTGPVVLTVAAQASNGVTFTVPAPSITSLTPSSGAVGVSVTIKGANFGTAQGTSPVAFNGTVSTPTTWTNTSISAPVPVGASTGAVVVSVGGQASNGVSFTVAAPNITSLSPISGAVGTAVTITGTNFGATRGTSTVTFNGTAATPTSWTSTKIVAAVPTGATTGGVVVTVGSQASNAVNFTVPAPTITSLSPTSGIVGTSITIKGTNFGTVQGTSTAAFNGVLSAPATWSNTSIVAPVPYGATTGNVIVTVGSQASNGVSFTVPAPVITSLSPASGPAGIIVTITGANFGASQGASTIVFNGVIAAPTAWSNTSLVVPVPSGAATGSVVVTVGGQTSNLVSFAVTTGPGITALSPTSGPLATLVTITGANFGADQGSSIVSFNGTPATPTSWGNTRVAAPVPNGASTGNVIVTVGGLASNGVPFAVAPAITSLSTSAGAVGTPVTITGTNFGASQGSSTLSFNGTVANPTSWTNTSIAATVPYGATTGNVTVTVGGLASNGLSFTVKVISVAVSPASTTVQLSQSATFTASVLNDVGNAGVNWNLSGSGCSGSACGTLSSSTSSAVTYTAPAIAPNPGMVTLTATSIADGTRNGASTITIVQSSGVTVSITPVRSGITVAQPLSLTATVQNDLANAGVTWTASNGTLTNQTPSSATFTALTAGVSTITAVSQADTSRSASAVIGVTDLSAVTTWRYDSSRSGVNSQEYALTKQNVQTSTFGKLFSCPVNGYIYAQPLWVSNVSIGSSVHNMVFVATDHDSLYAFDADGPGCKNVWSNSSISLLGPGEAAVPSPNLNTSSFGATVGVTGTPVIDPSSQSIYLVAMSYNPNFNSFIQRLHAIDITTGQERPGSPVEISASVAGSGYDNSNGIVTFDPQRQNQRPALLLLNGVIYVSWASFDDTDYYHGWVIGYSTSTLAQVSIFNDTPDGREGGIWMSGGGPAVDPQGSIYLLTGNGDFTANSIGGRDYGDTFLKLNAGLSVTDWFTPYNQASLSQADLDLGGGGAVIFIDQSVGPYPHLIVGGGKGGTLYLLNRDNLGQFNSSSDSQIVQSLPVSSNGIYATPLFWQNTLYVGASDTPLGSFVFSPLTGQFQSLPSANSSAFYGFPGATPALSAAGASGGILWAIQRASASPAVLHAYDATNLNIELWNSSQASNNRDLAGTAVKFTVPTIANGKVYVGTQTELDVYGLLPN
jgi:hypothetical protein